MTRPYGSRPTTRRRRTKREIGEIRGELWRVLHDDNPMTVRQVFYQMVSRGAIPKTEAEYKQTVIRLLADMRRDGDIPFGWIADNTRWMRKPSTHSSAEQFLDKTAKLYRRSIWDEQDVYVEVWLEKDALAGVLYDVTAHWDVPLMVTRGYPSLSYVYEAAAAIEAQEKPTYLYYFGDHDPSGVDIPRNVRERLAEFAPNADINFEVVAVTPAQITEWNLPTRPTKHTDTRAKSFQGESVEVDAIPPAKLRQLAQDVIEQHVDRSALDRMRTIEQAERSWLTTLGAKIPRRIRAMESERSH